jgi:hypothetical protein
MNLLQSAVADSQLAVASGMGWIASRCSLLERGLQSRLVPAIIHYWGVPHASTECIYLIDASAAPRVISWCVGRATGKIFAFVRLLDDVGVASGMSAFGEVKKGRPIKRIVGHEATVVVANSVPAVRGHSRVRAL